MRACQQVYDAIAKIEDGTAPNHDSDASTSSLILCAFGMLPSGRTLLDAAHAHAEAKSKTHADLDKKRALASETEHILRDVGTFGEKVEKAAAARKELDGLEKTMGTAAAADGHIKRINHNIRNFVVQSTETYFKGDLAEHASEMIMKVCCEKEICFALLFVTCFHRLPLHRPMRISSTQAR